MEDQFPEAPATKLRELEAKTFLSTSEKDLLTYLRDLKATYDTQEKRMLQMAEEFGCVRTIGRYYNLEGRPISMWEWSEILHTDRIIARNELGDYLVSTVYLGIDHARDESNPLIFETMIFALTAKSKGDKLDQWLQRYHTVQEAKKGHKETCKMVMGHVRSNLRP